VLRRLSTLLVLGLLVPILGAPAGASARSTVAIVDCTAKPVVKPTSIIIACADANRYVAAIAWQHWGNASASATGVLRWNDCAPSCVAGHWHHRAITFRATNIQVRHGRPLYTQLYAGAGVWGGASHWWTVS